MTELDALFHGFSIVMTWYNLGMMMIGLVLGVIIGVLPGLGGPNGVAILLPLTFSTGAGSAARRSLGTAVFGGMALSTVLTLFFTPLLFVLVDRLTSSLSLRKRGEGLG